MDKEQQIRSEEQWLIQAVKPMKKEKRRYLIFVFECEEPVLSVHEDMLIQYRLMKGHTITDELVKIIQQEDDEYSAYLLAVKYLGTKSRTCNQIRLYLRRKQLEEIHIDSAIDRLEKEQLVDDEQYAKQFADARMTNHLKGRLMIRQELAQRGVSKADAAEAIANLDRAQELAAAQALANKKYKSLKGDSKDQRKKLMGFLLRRGFPGDIVRETLKSFNWGPLEGHDEEDDGVMLDN